VSYGKELIVDLFGCMKFPQAREDIEKFLVDLCKLIDMEREDLHFWDYDGDPEGYADAPDHLKGISAVQFIRTSNVTIHTIDVPQMVLLNIFSCKDFETEKVLDFCKVRFGTLDFHFTEVERG